MNDDDDDDDGDDDGDDDDDDDDDDDYDEGHWPTLNFSIGLATRATESKFAHFLLHQK